MYHNFSIITHNQSQKVGEISHDVNYIIYKTITEKYTFVVDMGPIKDYIYNKYPDNFKQIIISNFELLKNTDLIVTGKIQIGKTSVIITEAWISLYCKNEIPIIISWDKLGVLSQTKARMDEFDRDIITTFNTNSYSLNTKEINTGDLILPNANPSCLITILTFSKLTKLTEIIKRGIQVGKKYRIIIDEADQSVKEASTSAETILMTNFINGHCSQYVNFTYVSATNFVIYNNVSRFINRQYHVIRIPDNIYEKKGLIYRSHENFEKISTEVLSMLTISGQLDTQLLIDIINLLEDFTHRQNNHQPNIGLFNIFHKNENKENFAEQLSLYIPHVNIVTYKSPDSNVYYSGYKIKTFKKGTHVAQILDYFQNEYKLINTNRPILIISTGLAGRAQTFKTSDNNWILTHHYFDKKNPSITSLLQGLRGSGQYKSTDIILKFYASQHIMDLLGISNYNNEILTNNIIGKQYELSMRNIIEKTAFLSFKGKPIKFEGRSKLDDTKSIGISQDYNAIENTLDDIMIQAELLKTSHHCDEIIQVAKLYYIPIQLYYDIINKSIQYRTQLVVKFNSNEPYKGLPATIQTQLRYSIEQYLRSKNIIINSCQICYDIKRQNNLNKLHHLKILNYQAQVISLDCNRKDTIPIVIYDQNYINNPCNFNNKVLVWPGTDSKYRCYVFNSMENKLNIYHLTHKNIL